MTGSIAIVGLACVYPDANTPEELWENVLTRRRSMRRIPAERLPLSDYYDPDRTVVDRTYATQAALIDGYEFDRVAFKIAGTTFDSADMTHWLALDTASRAFANSGLSTDSDLDRRTVGVVVGNSLTGEGARAQGLRLRWPYVGRLLGESLRREGRSSEDVVEFLAEFEKRFKEPFAPPGEESLAGALSNTIAGRICNHFDFQGGGYTVDGACASSLLAVTQACSALVARDLDVVLAGGVDISLDPLELVGFARTGALASGEMRVYDERSDGFHPGEGCGFVVLMREKDARDRGLDIRAIVRGWGISSDGAGGLTRPEGAGQWLALERAYARAGVGIETVGYFEGHGTGTAVGDAVELTTLSAARRAADASAPPAAIGSIKANFGHTKAAAGVAGLIKGLLVLGDELIPPTTGCERPHPVLCEPNPALRVPNDGECWPKDAPMRVGVSAMGFGGINTHVVLEGPARGRKSRPSVHDQRRLATFQDAELFLFAAPTRSELSARIDGIRRITHRLSQGEFADLAGRLAQDLARTSPSGGSVRAAVVASGADDLADRLDELARRVEDPAAHGSSRHERVFLGSSEEGCRIGFLFPGQGAPSHVGGGELHRRFAVAHAPFENLHGLHVGADGPDHATEIAQPSIVAASIATLRVLETLGVRAVGAVGHSLGEITALHWSGAFAADAAVRIALRRGHAMADLGGPPGSMANIDAEPEIVESLTKGIDVVIASYNAPRRTVISGADVAVNLVIARAAERGVSTTRLRVSHAFHSPLVAAAAGPLRECLRAEHPDPVRRDVFSTITGERLKEDADLEELLCRQVTAPVRFRDALEALASQVDLMIEVGPGAILAALAVESVDSPVISTDGGSKSLAALLAAVGAAFAQGASLDVQALFGDRCLRPFDPDRKPKFFVNPCERNVAPDSVRVELPASGTPATEPEVGDETLPSEPIELIRSLVATRVDLPLSAIEDDSRMLNDLHLNSIVVGEVVAMAARRCGKVAPVATADFANATVREIADAIDRADRRADSPREEPFPHGVSEWVHAFRIDAVERPRAASNRGDEPGGWSVLSPPNHRFAGELEAALAGAPGRGVVVWLSCDTEGADANRLLDGARQVLAEPDGACFAVVHHGGGGGGFARTLHLENPGTHTCVLDVPAEIPESVGWIAGELRAAGGHVEACFDAAGKRFEPALQPLPFAEHSEQIRPSTAWTEADVVAISGGGKGITAECALHLARESGCALLLMGRARPGEDAALAANLQRFEDAGVRFIYVPTDVTDAAEVRAAFARCVAELGAPTVILHGAGRNEPRKIADLDEDTVAETVAPKVFGLRNFLESADPDRVRLLVTFGSIIARLGLPGEAHYALANEWMARETARYSESHPACRCIALEWSVWAGAGMGESLDVIDTLRRSGVTPIGIDAGIRQFTDLLSRPEISGSVVVSGRFGAPPTLASAAKSLPLLRFLEVPRVHVAGVELVADAALSVDSDPYLRDHAFEGTFLFPAVLGLEAMAQTAAVLLEDTALLEESHAGPVVFERVAFERPISVPGDEPLRLRTAALRRGAREVEVVIRSESSDFAVDHFRAVCTFPRDATRRDPPPPNVTNGESPTLEITPLTDLYGRLLFQSGRFRRIVGYRNLHAHECEAELSRDGDESWFGRYLPDALVLGDPGGRDAVMHAVQACIPHARVLPVAVERIVIERGPRPARTFVRASERGQEEGTLIYDVEVLDEENRVLEAWQGLALRVTGSTPEFDAGWTAPLLGPFTERLLEDLTGSSVGVAFERNGVPTRKQRSERVVGQAVGRPVSLRARPDGRPELLDGQSVSIAHTDDITMAVSGDGEIGCDLETIASRSMEVWTDLLGSSGCDLSRRIMQEQASKQAAGQDAEQAGRLSPLGTDAEEFDGAATRVWSATECLRKIGVSSGPLTLKGAGPAGWVLLESGGRTVATYAAQLRDRDPVVLAVLLRSTR